ncbi:MAG TPA: T9SS type A sorting domain-containing protein, partial [Candidatus Krumholzibacteria bacterium]|nr:T9SS type A sorting domain-containing protein [Candidatus Krumholzibacteria bacterium]
DGSGAFPWLQWSTVCSLGGSRESPLVVKSNEDFVVAWRDGRPGDIFAQRIDDATGYWGIVVPPAITSVTDSPGDGGGNVDIAWNACDRDNLTTDVREYHVFRSLDQSSWTQVATVDATGLASYALSNVPTTADNLTHYFYIDAVGGGLLQHHFPSQTGSGVSIDDPPNIPLSLNVEKIGSWYYLNWVPPSPCVGGAVCDVVGYRVYRRVMGGPAALSPTDDWTLIGESQNPQFTDQTVSPGEPQEWAVSALDAGGREGAMTAAFRIEDTTSDVGDVPARFVVAPNVPNPFGHSTELVFALPDERDVRVDVYDVAGRLVHSRSLGRQPSGWNRVQLPSGSLASGVYFYRVTAGRDVSTRKMVVRR